MQMAYLQPGTRYQICELLMSCAFVHGTDVFSFTFAYTVECHARCLLKVPHARHIDERLSKIRIAAYGAVDVEDRDGDVVRRCQHHNACRCDVWRRCRLPVLNGTRCRLVDIQNCAGTRCRSVSVRLCCAKMPATTHAAATFGEDANVCSSALRYTVPL